MVEKLIVRKIEESFATRIAAQLVVQSVMSIVEMSWSRIAKKKRIEKRPEDSVRSRQSGRDDADFATWRKDFQSSRLLEEASENGNRRRPKENESFIFNN